MLDWIVSVDTAILDWIQTHLRCALLDFLMPVITHLGSGGILWIAIAAALLCFRRYRKNGCMLVLALLCCLLVGNLFLKPLVDRMRPYEINSLVELLIAKLSDASFPSGHTMSSFAAATVLLYTDKRFGIPAAVLAALIGFSRLYLYVHYPSDVLAGLLLGVLLGILSVLLVNWLWRRVRPQEAPAEAPVGSPQEPPPERSEQP